MANLVDLARDFAQEIQDLVNKTICDNFVLQTIETNDGDAIRITTPFLEACPISKSEIVNGSNILGFGLNFTVDLDPVVHDLRVIVSNVQVNLIQENSRPIIRLEYERGAGIEPGEISKSGHRRHAAHVQVHGTSDDLSYLWGLHGRHKKRKLESLHIPVGGRRYRPTVEDFIEFLYLEQIVTGMKPGGLEVIEDGRRKWQRQQVKSIVTNQPELAAQVLREIGYQVFSN